MLANTCKLATAKFLLDSQGDLWTTESCVCGFMYTDTQYSQHQSKVGTCMFRSQFMCATQDMAQFTRKRVTSNSLHENWYVLYLNTFSMDYNFHECSTVIS